MSDSTRSRILEVMAEAVRVSRINDVYDADEIASDILAHLSAKGMAVVPVEPTAAMLDALHDKVLIRADPALRECSILNDRETYAAMLSASPYGKASMQEDEQDTRGDDAAIAPTTTDTKGKTK